MLRHCKWCVVVNVCGPLALAFLVEKDLPAPLSPVMIIAYEAVISNDL